MSEMYDWHLIFGQSLIGSMTSHFLSIILSYIGMSLFFTLRSSTFAPVRQKERKRWRQQSLCRLHLYEKM